jgi:hypothetical protein
MLMGFSGSSVSNYISAYYTWRSAGGLMPTSSKGASSITDMAAAVITLQRMLIQ